MARAGANSTGATDADWRVRVHGGRGCGDVVALRSQTISALAISLHKQGLLTEAEEVYRTAVASLEASVGKAHQRTRALGTKLVDNLIAQAKLLEAQDVAKYFRLEWSIRQPKKPNPPPIGSDLPLPSAVKGFAAKAIPR